MKPPIRRGGGRGRDKGIAFVSGDEGTFAHRVEVEQGGDAGKDDGKQDALVSRGGTEPGMAEPFTSVEDGRDAGEQDGHPEPEGLEEADVLNQRAGKTGHGGKQEEFDAGGAGRFAEAELERGEKEGGAAVEAAADGGLPVPEAHVQRAASSRTVARPPANSSPGTESGSPGLILPRRRTAERPSRAWATVAAQAASSSAAMISTG